MQSFVITENHTTFSIANATNHRIHNLTYFNKTKFNPRNDPLFCFVVTMNDKKENKKDQKEEKKDLNVQATLYNELILSCPNPKCNSMSLLPETLEKCRPIEKYDLMCWLQRDLDNTDAVVTLHTSTETKFNMTKVVKYIENSPQNYIGGTGFAVRMDKRMLGRVTDRPENHPNCYSTLAPWDKNNPANSYVRNFVNYMIDEEVGLLTDDFCEEHGWKYPLKLYVDALIIDSFIQHVNQECGGFKKAQFDELQVVLDKFNNNAVTNRHEDHFVLSINRKH